MTRAGKFSVSVSPKANLPHTEASEPHEAETIAFEKVEYFQFDIRGRNF